MDGTARPATLLRRCSGLALQATRYELFRFRSIVITEIGPSFTEIGVVITKIGIVIAQICHRDHPVICPLPTGRG
jgi:hypothetical protein